MNTEGKWEAHQVIRELMEELNDAYQGLHTLPTDHPARIAYAKGDKYLEREPA